MAKKKKTKKENDINHEEHDENTCPECGKKSKPVVDMFEGEHFTIWGNDDFISVNFYFNDVVLTFPAELWEEMRPDFQVMGMTQVPYSDENGTTENGSITPEELN